MPSPIGRGWEFARDGTNEQLIVDWMDGQPAPQAILDLLACNCPRNCELPKCECMVNGLKCTEMCRLLDCDNQAASMQNDEESNDEQNNDLDDDDKMEDELNDNDYEY